MEKPNDPELNFHGTVPPGAEDYQALVLDMLASMDYWERKMICDGVYFEFTKIETNAFMLPMRVNRQAYIVFVIPPSRPFLGVVAHELAHFLKGHHLHPLQLQEGPYTARPNMELEEAAEQKAQNIIHNYSLWQDRAKDRAVWINNNITYNIPVCCLRQGG